MGIIANAITKIRSSAANWLAPGQHGYEPEDHLTEREKIHAGVAAPKFLPFWDNLQNLGETQKMRLAYRVMCKDAFVKASLYNKISTVMQTEIQISPKNKKDAREQLIADFCQWVLVERQRGGMASFIWSILSGMLIDGFSVCEPVWEIEEDGAWQGKEVLADLKPKDVDQDLVIETDEFNNITNLLGLRFNGGQNFDPADYVISQYLPLYSNPTGQSDLTAAYRPYFWLNTVTILRGFGAEKRAFPVVGGSFKDPTKRAALDAALSKIKSSNWLTYPEETKIELFQLAGSAEDYFKSFRADCVEEIVTSIAWASLQAVGGKDGQIRGDSEVHEDTSDKSVWVLTELIKQVLNNHKSGVIRRLTDRNFSGVMHWPKANFGKKDAGALKEEMALWTSAQGLGWIPSKEDFTEKFGLRWGQGDDALNPPQAQQPGQMPGQNPPMQFGDDWVELPDEVAKVFEEGVAR